MFFSLRLTSFLACGTLLFSTSAPLLKEAKEVIAGLKFQQTQTYDLPWYADTPTPAYLGGNPGRFPHSRGGIWNAWQLRDLEQQDWLAMAGGGQGGILPPASDASGSALPWEGTASAAAGSVNTANGDKLTQIALFGWKQRGGLPLQFTMYHNSEGGAAGGAGYGWSTSFDIFINTSGSSPVVRWGDGLSIPYTVAGSTYTAPAGIYDTLTHTSGNPWVLTKKDGTVYTFSSAGLLSSIADRNGNTASVTWTSSNIVSSVTDSTGRSLSISSTGTTISSVTDPMSHTWTFTQNGSGDLTSISWPTLGGSTYTDGFTYTSHCITTHTDRNGKNWGATYNTGGIIATETDPLSNSTSYSYTSSATTITDPLSHTIVDNYSSGIQASHVDQSGYSTSYTARDSNNNPTSITDVRGKVWGYTYDSVGNVLTVTDPNSHVKTFTYNGFAEVLTAEDALSHTTTNTYDSHGNLLTVTDPLSHVTTTNTYDSYGQIATSEDAVSNTTTYAFDSNGNLSDVTTPLSNSTSFGYDALGRRTSVTDPLSHVETTSYDVWGRKSVVTHADTSYASYTYLPTDQVYTYTDELGHTGTYAYDNAGRLTSFTNARSDVESYGYDNANHRTSVTNGRGYTRTYTVTNRGEVTKLVLPDGIITHWQYDGASNLRYYENGNADTIQYIYDDANRETNVYYPAGTNTSFGYDWADRRTQMVDATGTTTWSFDNASRLTGVSTPEGYTTYGYDNAGRKTTLVENGTATTTYGYDNDSRLTSLANSNSEMTTWSYDAAGRATSQTVASGEVSTFAYDNRNRETSVTHKTSGGTTLESESYVYDYAGNLTSKTVGSLTTTYGYDVINQLTSESNSGYSASYTYDANGNRTSKTLGGVTDTYTVDNGDKLTSTSTKTYTYDGDGRTKTVVSSAGTTAINYDYNGHITNIVKPSGTTYTYTYNDIGARVGKNEGTAQSFFRDGAEVTSPVLNDGIGHFTPGVSEHVGSSTTFSHGDQLGSFVAQSNSSQTVTATMQYDAFGQLVSSSGAQVGPFGFVGYQGYESDASGLQLLGHRYYDPSTGRFLTRDPAQDGRNWYGYVGNNPLQRVDPSGLVELWGFDFNWQTVGNGLATGVSGALNGLSGGLLNLGHQGDAGYGVSSGLGTVGGVALTLASGVAALPRATLVVSEEAAVGETAVIGQRSVARVLPVAERLGADAFTVGNSGKFGGFVKNVGWIIKQILTKDSILDIGPVEGKNPQGPWYIMERFITRLLCK